MSGFADATSDIAIHQQSRQHFARVVGLGYWVYWVLGCLAVAGFTCGAVGGWWAWREARVSADRVERYVIYIDSTSTTVGKVGIGGGWTPVVGTYLDFAKRWILYLRGRPLDLNTLTYQRGEVIRSTDVKLYGQLQNSMKAADEQVRTAAVDVDEISANLLKQEGDSAIVSVRWREQVRKAGVEPVVWIATLKIIYVEPKVKGEFERNLLGLYASEFQITRES